MAANTVDLAKLIKQWIAPELAAYGLTMPEFYIENVSLPDKVEEALDKRTSMGIVGDLGQFMNYSAAEALSQGGPAAGGMLTGLGAGMGMGMAQQMGGGMVMGPWGPQPQPVQVPQPAPAQIAPPPPPPPVEKVWHVAVSGEATGPYSRADLGRMVTSGDLGRETHVWTPGQDGWKEADEVPELAQLFTILPPPPPGA